MSSYVSPVYEATQAVENFNGVPRFGHSDDITNVIDGDGRFDYISGIIFIPCFMISVYILWIVLVSIFKCCKVRFVSGKNLKPGKSAFVIRSIFLFFNLSAVLALILYVTKGASSFIDVLDSVQNVSQSLGSTGDRAVELTGRLVETSNNIIPLRDDLVTTLNSGLCPADPTLNDELSDLTSDLVDSLTLLDNFFQDDILRIQEGFASTLAETDDIVDQVFDVVGEWLRFLPYSSIPCFINVGLLFIGLILTWIGSSPKCYSSILTCFVLPILLASILLFIISSSILSIAGVGLSDLCLGGDTESPEGTIQAIMEEVDQLEGTGLELFEYYIISGCRDEDPLIVLEELSDGLQPAIEFIGEVIDSVEPQKDDYSAFCGTDFGETVDSFTSVQSLLVDMDESLDIALDITSCETVNGIVIDVAHVTTCDKIPTAIGWMFVCFTLFGMCAMMMYMFRSACFPNEKASSDEDDEFLMAVPVGDEKFDMKTEKDLKPVVIGDED